MITVLALGASALAMFVGVMILGSRVEGLQGRIEALEADLADLHQLSGL